MKFDLRCSIQLSRDASSYGEDLKDFMENMDIDAEVEWKIDGESLNLHIVSTERRSHEWALRLYKQLTIFFGKRKVGLRGIHVDRYEVEFEMEREALKPINIPFATVIIDGKKARIVI